MSPYSLSLQAECAELVRPDITVSRPTWGGRPGFPVLLCPVIPSRGVVCSTRGFSTRAFQKHALKEQSCLLGTHVFQPSVFYI